MMRLSTLSRRTISECLARLRVLCESDKIQTKHYHVIEKVANSLDKLPADDFDDASSKFDKAIDNFINKKWTWGRLAKWLGAFVAYFGLSVGAVNMVNVGGTATPARAAATAAQTPAAPQDTPASLRLKADAAIKSGDRKAIDRVRSEIMRALDRSKGGGGSTRWAVDLIKKLDDAAAAPRAADLP